MKKVGLLVICVTRAAGESLDCSVVIYVLYLLLCKAQHVIA